MNFFSFIIESPFVLKVSWGVAVGRKYGLDVKLNSVVPDSNLP